MQTLSKIKQSGYTNFIQSRLQYKTYYQGLNGTFQNENGKKKKKENRVSSPNDIILNLYILNNTELKE